MEMGSTESLNGLKFGRKIYFEDSSSSSSGGPVGLKKVRSSSVNGGQPPKCQVEGCKVDLSDAKAYYSRHRVCGMHSKSSLVIVAGLQQRFCQQCSRFHLLPEFDQGKRSCRRRLAGHNERRRKPPPGSLLPTPYGQSDSHLSFSEASSGRVGSFLMDFSAQPRVGPTGRIPEHLPYLWQGCGNPESMPPLSPPGHFMSITASHGISPLVSDSSCALSLLSNQNPWGPRTRSPSGFVSHCEMNDELPTSATPHLSMVGVGSGQSLPGLGLLGQLAQPPKGHFSGEHQLSHQQSRRPYLDPGLSTDFDSSTHHHVNWSL